MLRQSSESADEDEAEDERDQYGEVSEGEIEVNIEISKYGTALMSEGIGQH